MATELTEDQFYNVLQTGTLWTIENIAERVRELKDNRSDVYGFTCGYEDGNYYVYSNEVYLFVEDNKITVRNDRDDGMYALSSWTFNINKDQDITRAFSDFLDCTIEADENYMEDEE